MDSTYKCNFSEKTIVELVQFVINLMVLDNKRESQFQDTFYKPFQKKGKMTATEYDKQKLDGIYLAYYGETVEQRDKRIAKEVAETKNRQSAFKLYFQHKWQISEIALFLDVSEDFVKKVIKN